MREVTPQAAQQLRLTGDLIVLHFRPRMGAGSDQDVPMVDRFNLLRQAMGSLSLGLNDTVAVDYLYLTRVHKQHARFVTASMALRAHVVKNIELLRGVGSTKLHGDMIDEDFLVNG